MQRLVVLCGWTLLPSRKTRIRIVTIKLLYVVPWLMADLKVALVRSVDASDALTPWSEEHAAMAITADRMLRMNMVKGRRGEGGVMGKEKNVIRGRSFPFD